MTENEKIIEADRQKVSPIYDKDVISRSLKYWIEITVSIRSLMLETLAFSKGDIFMLIVLAA